MRKFHISKKAYITAAVLLLAVGLLIAGGIWAKYLENVRESDVQLSSKAFYFRSDYLTENNSIYNLNEGTDEVSVQLFNHENGRVSQVAITYTVTVESEQIYLPLDGEQLDGTFSLNGTASVDGKATVSLSVGVSSEPQSTLVSLTELKNGFNYIVTVTANGGYTKTLSATFSVGREQNGFYTNVDATNDQYVILTVWTENVSGVVTVEFPAGLIPDTTDPVMEKIQNYDDEDKKYVQGTFSDAESFVNYYASRSYRFFKTEGYDPEAEFTVTMGSRSAVESNLP